MGRPGHRIGRYKKNHEVKHVRKPVGRPNKQKRENEKNTPENPTERRVNRQEGDMEMRANEPTERRVNGQEGDMEMRANEPTERRVNGQEGDMEMRANEQEGDTDITMDAFMGLIKEKITGKWLTDTSSNRVRLVKLQDQSSSACPVALTHCILVESDFTWRVIVHGHEVTSSFQQIPSHLNPDTLKDLVSLIERMNICPGHPDKKFVDMMVGKEGKSLCSGAYLDTNAAVELNGINYDATVRSESCSVLTSATKCVHCTKYCVALRSTYHRWHKRKHSMLHSGSRSNYRWLTTPEKVKRLQTRVKSAENALHYMKSKIESSVNKHGVNVDDSLHSDLVDILSSNSASVQKEFREGSFHRLFWDQQIEALAVSPTQRRWHPMLIRWCLHLRMLSPAAYNSLRGILKLPCGRTLQDYTRWIKAGVGIQPEVIKQLRDEVGVDSLEEWQKYVGVVFDEVKIKEGIVYDKEYCSVVGFIDLGAVTNALLDYERSINHRSTIKSTVATHMLVFMVRGIFIRLSFPFAQYPTNDLCGGVLYPLAWGVIRSLECAGLKVISLTADKASPNRKFFAMHPSDDQLPPFKVSNPYSIEKRYIYFVSDVPHLLKTTRNCWSNSFGHSYKRPLWINGQHISWKHIEMVYKNRTKSGLTRTPKLTREHIHLTSYSRMRVDLAAQALSKTVADAMEVCGDDEVRETVRFIRMFDRFFDLLNTRSLEEGNRKRKPDLLPYREMDDPRLDWLENEFLGYLNEWEECVKMRPNFSQAEKNKMCLSKETLSGLRMTVRAFVEMVRYLLCQNGIKFLYSERFTQDPLEAFFGQQRSRGGYNDNPTVKQFCENTVSLRLQRSNSLKVMRGSCRKRPLEKEITIDHAPLPKRKRK